MTLSVAWFSTGRGEGSRRLLTAAVEAIREGSLDAKIAFVFCNRERGEHGSTDGFLDLVASFGIPSLTLSSRGFRRERGGALSKPGEQLPPWRVDYDRAVAELLGKHPFDIGLLAGYMLIFTPEMARRYPFLNLHPAEPGGPVGTWQEVIWELIERRADRSGVMIHLATEDLDQGPPVTYCTYSIRGLQFDSLWADLDSRAVSDIQAENGEEHPLFREIRRQGAMREVPLIVATLRVFAEHRARVDGRRVLDASGHELSGPLDLTEEIAAALTDA